jgi:protein-S-isoprenylcysteine O-methyltransferase Ste14
MHDFSKSCAPLAARFGEAFADYQRRVPADIPFM